MAMMTRSEAVDVLREVIEGGILREDLQDSLEEIEMILTHEDENDLTLWGAEEDDVNDLFVALREDLITKAWEQHINELKEKYKLK